MSKYIDADALLKNINENVAKAHNERCAQLLEAILYAPTADVVEVRHGEWLHETRLIEDKIYHRWYCSICGRTVATVKRESITDYPYCHCGAKMDGERKDTE